MMPPFARFSDIVSDVSFTLSIPLPEMVFRIAPNVSSAQSTLPAETSGSFELNVSFAMLVTLCQIPYRIVFRFSSAMPIFALT